jgi:hypothetical protein
MPAFCSIKGCARLATRATLFKEGAPASIFCDEHYEQIKTVVTSHRDKGWIENDVPVSIKLYKKKEGGRLVAFFFPEKVVYREC